ncbi:ATP-binding cassette domain-containing protein [Natronomonas sp. CBA1123]|uniref:ABC transporter ATP-binding protein n=1 Tax=Natronomonas sp. CBA1123 TaxID=2668070 RepID=UPI0012E9BBFE|nr:ABC transporter ATP-binding protein [Natronomonas sp. CBA1123]MUV87628.1 ATP-binding cassette domain-containing protein [Natronomonas sp. CBA1123]
MAESAVGADEDDPFEEQRENAENPMSRLFAEYGRPNALQVTVGVLASIFARLLDLLPPIMLGLAIDSVFGEQAFSLWLVPEAWTPTDEVTQFWVVIGIIAGAFALGAAFHWIRNWGFNSFAQNIQHSIRTDTYDTMQRLNMDFFADKQTGELMSILSNDVNRLERFLNDGLNSMFRLSVMVLGIGGVLLYYNWQLALIALLPVPLIAGFTYLFIRIIQPKYARVRSSVGKVNSRLENNLGGIQVIKSANTEPYESDRVDDVSMEYFDANWDAIETRIKFFPGLRLLAGIGFVVTFIVGGLWVFTGTAPGPLTGDLSVGTFVVFILFTQRFIWPMAQFGQIINMYQRAYASSERIFGLMDEPDRLAIDPDAEPLDVESGRVEYDEVTFGYDGEETIVEDIDFTVDGGETLALVGPTGAGKSTVLKLLLRLYDVDEGAIRIDGQDIRNVTLPSLRQHIGYVGQDTFLFYGTVRENITYGTFDADEEAVIEAAKAAEAHDFITNLPDGYDTMVGERGVKLSGGQRQRISIARAVLKDPAILVLDEATSDVDTETEMLIQRSLDRLTADRTTFAIAHRLSTIKDADTIVVLEDGEIVERGTHEDLLDEGGLYAHLWGVQAGEIDELPEEFIERAAERQARTDADDD